MISKSQQLPNHFIEYIREELMIRHKKNPRYSLRAFSKQVQLSSSFVSKLLNGKRPLTKETFLTISSRLAIPLEIERHYLEVEFENENSKVTKENKVNLFEEKPNSSNYLNLHADQFKFIADWYHFAILELISVEGFIPNPNSIASQLGITSLEAKESLDRLIRMNLIKTTKTKSGKVQFTTSNFTTIDKKIATAATFKQQNAILNKAIEALENTPIEERSQTSMTLAIPQSRLVEAEKLIKNFRRDLTELLQRKGKRDSVYQLSISFFPLTQNKKSINNK